MQSCGFEAFRLLLLLLVVVLLLLLLMVRSICVANIVCYKHMTPPPPPPTLNLTLNPRLGYNDISADGASALASLLHAGSSALDSLELQGNHIGDAGATAVANGLAGGGKRGRKNVEAAAGLRSLNLAGNGIGCAGGLALANALSGGCALEELDLTGNAVSLFWCVDLDFVLHDFLSCFASCGSAGIYEVCI